jgi:hypothetical protein
MHYRLIFLFFLPLKNVSLTTIKGEIEKTFPSLEAQSVGAFFFHFDLKKKKPFPFIAYFQAEHQHKLDGRIMRIEF